MMEQYELDGLPTVETIAAMQQGNDRRIQMLRQQGVAIDMASIVSQRVSALCDLLIGEEGTPERLTFEYALACRYAAMLDNTEAQVRMATLAPGAQQTSKLIIP
jgi:hypothetical protein